MAHFCSYPKTDKITEITLPNSLDPGADSVTIGLWGFQDFDGNELEILRPPYLSVKRGDVKGQVRLYNLSGYHPGQWSLEARTQSGITWDRLTVFVKTLNGPPATGGKYTNNPNEVVTQRTTPTARDVISMLLQAWPQLTEQGARTLTAQFMGETGEGKYCFNWNLGNVKAGANDRHMYLRDVWECYSQSSAQPEVDRANGLAHIATADEIRKRGWKCPAAVVVFEPPHYECRFRAYSNLTEGAQRWLGHHQQIARNNPNFLTSINNGDVPAVAHALKQVQYYSAAEADYSAIMTREKRKIDQKLGAP